MLKGKKNQFAIKSNEYNSMELCNFIGSEHPINVACLT